LASVVLVSRLTVDQRRNDVVFPAGSMLFMTESAVYLVRDPAVGMPLKFLSAV